MKTSKIILTSYLGVIGLFLLSFLIQVPPERKERIKKENLQFLKSELSGVTHIVVKDGSFDLISGNKDSLIVSFNKNRMYVEPVYKVSGDTLFIIGNKNADTYFTKVSCKNVQEVILDHSNCDVNDSLINRIEFKGITSHIYFRTNKMLAFLSVDITENSNVYGNSVKIDTLHILSNSSTCELYDHSSVNYVSGEIRDSSIFTAKNVYEIKLKVDSLSKFNIW